MPRSLNYFEINRLKFRSCFICGKFILGLAILSVLFLASCSQSTDGIAGLNPSESLIDYIKKQGAHKIKAVTQHLDGRTYFSFDERGNLVTVKKENDGRRNGKPTSSITEHFYNDKNSCINTKILVKYAAAEVYGDTASFSEIKYFYTDAGKLAMSIKCTNDINMFYKVPDGEKYTGNNGKREKSLEYYEDTTIYVYNETNQLTRKTSRFFTGGEINYFYSDGRLDEVIANTSKKAGTEKISYSYDNLNNVTQVVWHSQKGNDIKKVYHDYSYAYEKHGDGILYTITGLSRVNNEDDFLKSSTLIDVDREKRIRFASSVSETINSLDNRPTHREEYTNIEYYD